MYGEATTQVGQIFFSSTPGIRVSEWSPRVFDYQGSTRTGHVADVFVDPDISPALRRAARERMHQLGRHRLRDVLKLEAMAVRADDHLILELAPAWADPLIDPDIVVWDLELPDWQPRNRLLLLATGEPERSSYYEDAGTWARHFAEKDDGEVAPLPSAQDKLLRVAVTRLQRELEKAAAAHTATTP